MMSPPITLPYKLHDKIPHITLKHYTDKVYKRLQFWHYDKIPHILQSYKRLEFCLTKSYILP